MQIAIAVGMGLLGGTFFTIWGPKIMISGYIFEDFWLFLGSDGLPWPHWSSLGRPFGTKVVPGALARVSGRISRGFGGPLGASGALFGSPKECPGHFFVMFLPLFGGNDFGKVSGRIF